MHGLEVFVDAGNQIIPVLRGCSCETQACHATRWYAHAYAKTRNRIKAIDRGALVCPELGVWLGMRALLVTSQKGSAVCNTVN